MPVVTLAEARCWCLSAISTPQLEESLIWLSEAVAWMSDALCLLTDRLRLDDELLGSGHLSHLGGCCKLDSRFCLAAGHRMQLVHEVCPSRGEGLCRPLGHPAARPKTTLGGLSGTIDEVAEQEVLSSLTRSPDNKSGKLLAKRPMERQEPNLEAWIKNPTLARSGPGGLAPKLGRWDDIVGTHRFLPRSMAAAISCVDVTIPEDCLAMQFCLLLLDTLYLVVL
ncbi:hypothetical protein VTK56DRAFT_2929 [Thermocarpiscus australiensis]